MINIIEKIRLSVYESLVFFSFLIGCRESKNASISIIWEQGKAVGISIPKKLLKDLPSDSLWLMLHIRLAKNKTSVLGEYNTTGDELVFRPLIAFTRGLKYEISTERNLLGEIEIPMADPANAPEVTNVYPALDTLPENLLKFYILFSKPMQEGGSLNHIQLIKNGNDTLASVFLDLQNELWNSERTMLTLWLDPGRIKRDLQPNLRLGPPLQKGEHYELYIKNDWQDQTGALLKKDYQKKFFTAHRDSLSPIPGTWKITVPGAGSKEALKANFNDALDPILAVNTIRIVDKDNGIVEGAFHVNEGGVILDFTPAVPWKPGKYFLEIESTLEVEPAGNNLNHLFDADLTQKAHKQQDVFKRSFEIK